MTNLNGSKKDSLIINPASKSRSLSRKALNSLKDWSLNAINIVAQKYFAGTPGTRKGKVAQNTNQSGRTDTITRSRPQAGYFADNKEAETFSEELKYILASQRAAFNSPVWFNIGAEGRANKPAPVLSWASKMTWPRF